MSEDNNCITEQKKNSFLLNLVIVISSLFVISLFIGHLIYAKLPNRMNLDIVFFTICLFSIIRKNLNLAKLACVCFLIMSFISIAHILSLPNKTVVNLILCVVSLAPFPLLWLGIIILSKSQKESWLLGRNIPACFTQIDADAKRSIGIITALCALLQFIPHNPHIAIVWLSVYIFSIIKRYVQTAKIMLMLWFLPYIIHLGKLIYISLSLNYAVFSGTLFLVCNGMLLYIGIQGLGQLDSENEIRNQISSR